MQAHVRIAQHPHICLATMCRVHHRADVSRMQERRTRDLEEAEAKATTAVCQPDDLIDFAHLKHRRGVAQVRTCAFASSLGCMCEKLSLGARCTVCLRPFCHLWHQ